MGLMLFTPNLWGDERFWAEVGRPHGNGRANYTYNVSRLNAILYLLLPMAHSYSENVRYSRSTRAVGLYFAIPRSSGDRCSALCVLEIAKMQCSAPTKREPPRFFSLSCVRQERIYIYISNMIERSLHPNNFRREPSLGRTISLMALAAGFLTSFFQQMSPESWDHV